MAIANAAPYGARRSHANTKTHMLQIYFVTHCLEIWNQLNKSNLQENAASPAGDASGEKKQSSKWWFGRADKAWFACVAGLLLLSVAFVSHREDEWSFDITKPSGGSIQSHDVLLDGLLASGFDENSCKSRYQWAIHSKKSPHKPSQYLVERLRKYEVLHQQCAPNTHLYIKSMKMLESKEPIEPSECKYAVWIPNSGLGNKMISIASVFLYALLTDRVLLVDRGTDLEDLFCEPFPGGSWLLPLDSHLRRFQKDFHRDSPRSLGTLLRNNNKSDNDAAGYAYVHLTHDFNVFDQLFFCDQGQERLRGFPWLVFLSNQYFVPGFFRMPAYEAELARLFPDTVTVFHHLGRYLFHPTNPVWGLITRSYIPYLSRADKRIGLQIRVFQKGAAFLRKGTNATQLLAQVMQCVIKEGVLSNVSLDDTTSLPPSTPSSTTVVLITSLSSIFFEHMKNMYWEHPTRNGEMISVYQPSHEEQEVYGVSSLDVRALAEIYLLSMTDMIVTSAYSTFGYVAQSIGGMNPWILTKTVDDGEIPELPCSRAMSIEPCYHAPPMAKCTTKDGMNVGQSYVRYCEDVSVGLKLVGRGV